MAQCILKCVTSLDRKCHLSPSMSLRGVMTLVVTHRGRNPPPLYDSKSCVFGVFFHEACKQSWISCKRVYWLLISSAHLFLYCIHVTFHFEEIPCLFPINSSVFCSFGGLSGETGPSVGSPGGQPVAPYLYLKAELLCYCAIPWISR
jgi:hypothetical protein